MKLETLVATMHQSDFSLVDKMNIQSDVIFANQCDRNGFEIMQCSNFTAKMVSTDTRGVGLNRNIALLMSSADILLFSDDDFTYNDGYAERVLRAFDELPDADMILFGGELTRNGEVYHVLHERTKRLHWWGAMKYGTYSIAVRRSSLLRHSIFFTQLFGGGCIYATGEDSKFILDCIRSGMRAYSYDYVLGRCAMDVSTCFFGYDEKYFYNKGAWLAASFPKGKHFMKWYFIFRFAKLCELSRRQIRRQINKGIRGYGRLDTYDSSKEQGDKK